MFKQEAWDVSHIVFISSDYKPMPGGIATYVDTLARSLIGLGNRVTLLAVVPADDADRITFLEDYEKWVVPFPVVLEERPKNWIGNWFVSLLEIVRCRSRIVRPLLAKARYFQPSCKSTTQLLQILRKEKPDVIIFGNLDKKLYSFALLLLEHQLPYMIIAHDSEIYRHSMRPNDRFVKGMFLKGACWVASNSRHTKGLVEEWGIAGEKIAIIHPPIAEELIDRSRKTDVIQSKEGYTILTICRLVKAKGIDIVLHALSILNAWNVPYRYIVVGDGAELSSLQGLAVKLGVIERTHFTGYVADETKWSLLESADVFVMPSRVTPSVQHEGFGIVFLEAAAFGVPSVGSRAGGIPDAIVDGETGILVEPESPERLAEALIFLYHNPETRKQMGNTGMRRAKNQFSPQTVAAQFQQEILKRI